MPDTVFYIVEHSPHGDVLRTYEGMGADVVSSLVGSSGNTFEFLAKDDYDARAAIAAEIDAAKDRATNGA